MTSPHHQPPPSTGLQFEPGSRVRNPARPDWGVGQVQSALGARVTVMFDHAGKVVMNTAIAPLVIAEPPGAPR